MNIEHKLEPIEHWIVDGKAYRLATEEELGKTVLVADLEITKRKSPPDIERTLTGIRNSQYRFEAGGTVWRLAYIQDDFLLAPQRTPVPALGDGWFLLTAEDGEFQEGDKISSDSNGRLWVPKSWPTCIKIAYWLSHDSACAAARYFGPAKEPEPTEKIEQPKPIDWAKPVRTKDGRAVRVLCTDGPRADYPVVGIIDGATETLSWAITGLHSIEHPSEYDLENAPQRIQREYWVNVYPKHIGEQCKSKERADDVREDGCLACVKITIDCEEGEGL